MRDGAKRCHRLATAIASNEVRHGNAGRKGHDHKPGEGKPVFESKAIVNRDLEFHGTSLHRQTTLGHGGAGCNAPKPRGKWVGLTS
jgi:hypothetical protein